METRSESGLIQVTAGPHRHVADRYEFVPRGQVLIKGKGPMETYFGVKRGAEESIPVTG